MQPEDLRVRTKKFAVDVIALARGVRPDHINNQITRQLTDAATAVASGYRAVCRARSRADFIYKLGNAIEEADESALWLEILTEAAIVPDGATASLRREADEIIRILVRSRETARANREAARRRDSGGQGKSARESPITNRQSPTFHQSPITNRKSP